MATLTNIPINSASLTGVSKTAGGGLVFYAWMFLFTIPQYNVSLTGIPKTNASLTNVAKS
jgi:hypothetical protein